MGEISGFMILDKPVGFTSRAIVDEVKKLLGAKTAGHIGTLDPNATGVLPILLGRATRIAPALERMDKEYIATVHLHADIGEAEVRKALQNFVGKIKQIPPVKSAVVRRERVREVYSVEVLFFEGKDVTLRIKCEAGTYIRKLASDLGLKIGGAHLKALRRTRAGPFDEKQAHTLEELRIAVSELESEDEEEPLANILLPVEKAVEHLPHVVVDDAIVSLILNGSPIRSGIVKTSGKIQNGALIAVLSMKGELLALGRGGSPIKIDRVISKK